MLATRGRAFRPWRLARGMRGERRGRVRWGNGGRAAIVVGLLGLAIAWPRLAPPPPRLPSDAGVPVAPPEARAASRRRSGRPRSRGGARGARGRRRGAGRRGGGGGRRGSDSRGGGGGQRGGDWRGGRGGRSGGDSRSGRGGWSGGGGRSAEAARGCEARRAAAADRDTGSARAAAHAHAHAAPSRAADVPPHRSRDNRVLVRTRVRWQPQPDECHLDGLLAGRDDTRGRRTASVPLLPSRS